MLNFPQVNDEHLRKLRAQLLSAPTDATWHGAVTQALQMLIDNDLGEHRSSRIIKRDAEREDAARKRDNELRKRTPRDEYSFEKANGGDWPTLDKGTVDKLNKVEDKGGDTSPYQE